MGIKKMKTTLEKLYRVLEERAREGIVFFQIEKRRRDKPEQLYEGG